MSGFRESDVYEHLCEELNRRLGDEVECKDRERVTYNLRFDHNLETKETEFSTDLCVIEEDYPRVIIEIKRDSATTHDLIAYDQKARRHKRVYPSLRYGMFLIESGGLTKRYLWHSDDLDFFYFSDRELDSIDDLPSADLDRLAELIKDNIETSHQIDRILSDEEKPKIFHQNTVFEQPELERG